MAINAQMNVRSILDLIASDFAYKPIIADREELQTFPDNTTGDDNSFPLSLALQLRREPLTQFDYFEKDGVTGVKLPQWEVVRSFESRRDGFGSIRNSVFEAVCGSSPGGVADGR